MSEFAGRYQRLSVRTPGSFMWSTPGLPQLVAIVAIAEGGLLHDPDGRLRLDAVRGSSAAAWSWSPGLRQLVLCPGLGKGCRCGR